MSSELDSILARIERKDPDTAKELRRHVGLLSKRREFGLNFQRHTPERVGLPGRPISVGDKVMFIAPRGESRVESADSWIVLALSGEGSQATAELRNTETGEKGDRLVSNLVFAADFRDPIFPGLASVERIENGDGPFHAIVNGENYHVLDALRYTHAAAVDLVYIDPPYNTGNEGWIYNDSYVAAEDGDKHSKWLAFMERRLKMARRLLKDTGVIIVAIGDDEHHRLRMLMDQVFGDQNFISDVVWNGSRKNDATFISNAADYMLFYAKDMTSLGARGKWHQPKAWAEEVLDAGAAAWEAAGGVSDEATKRLKAWFAKQPKGKFSASAKHYSLVDDQGRVFSEADPGFPNGKGPRYDVIHPKTGLPCRVPENGWRFNEDKFKQMIADGLVHFRADHTSLPRPKTFLAEQLNEKPESVFYSSRKAPAQHVAKILGDKRFPYPKDHEVLMRWFAIAAPRDAVILDFFAGSGSTAEAVLRLNAEDGGTRQSILVTNNELAARDAKALTKAGHRDGDPEWEAKGVFEHVTRPRISTVVTGERPDGSTYAPGLEANVEFFNLTYENPELVEMDLAFERIAALLWLKAGAEGRRIDTPAADFDIADTYAVLFDPDATAPFLKALRGAAGVRVVYVVTDDEPQYQAVDRQLPEGVDSARLYSSYLHTFTINTGAAED